MKFEDVVCYVCGKSLYTYSKSKEAYVTGSHVNHADKRQIILRYSQGVYKKGNNIRVKYIMMFSSYEEKNFPKSFYATYKNGKRK